MKDKIKIITLYQLLDFVETEEKANLLIYYINNLQHIEDLYNQLLKDYDELQRKNQKSKEMQREFIEYLENMLDNENDIFSVVRVKDVLLKYKEITGE